MPTVLIAFAIKLLLLSPMNAGPVLRVKEPGVEGGIGAHLRIFFRGANLSVDFEDDLRRHPPAAEPLVLVELRLLRLRSVLPRRSQHADKIQLLLVDPELRRMQVVLLCSHHIDGSALPRIFAQNRKIKLETLERLQDIRRRQFVDVKAENHQRMNEGPGAFLLAIFEGEDLSIREEDAVAVLDRGEVDAQRTGHGEGLVPRRDFLGAVFVIVRRLLHEGRRLIPGLAVLLLHGSNQFFGGSYFGSVSGRRHYDN